jgi:NACalpha-BTF3-like transcription factor
MALEGANIAGQAQVYNQTQKAVDVYAKTLAQQQARLAAEQKALQDDLSKVKVEGVRQGDMPEFLESYNKSKDIFNKLNATRNPSEKIRLKREFDESMLNTAAVGADSRELAKGEDAAAKMFMNPNIRDRYKPEAVEQFQLSKSLSRKDPRFVRDLSTLEQQIDLSKIMGELDKIDNELFKGEKSNLIETKGSRDGVSGLYTMEERKLSPERQALAYSAQFDLQPSFRVAMREVFPQFAELNNSELKAAVIPELVKQRAKSIYGDKKFDETGMSEYQRRSLALRESEAAGGGAGIPSNYTVETDTYLMTDPKVNKNFEEIKNSEKQSLKMAKSVGFDSDYFPLINAAAFDVNNQKRVSNVSGNFIAGKIAYVPVEDGSYGVRVVVINADGERFVVKPSLLPIGIRKSKNYDAALKALGEAPTKSPAGEQSKQEKKYSDSQEKGISAVMNTNKISRQEAISALINAGRLSK